MNPDDDGADDDPGAKSRPDFTLAVTGFRQMDWIAANEPREAFGLNGNGRIDFADIVALFNEI